MNEISAIAIDSAKSVFEVGLFDREGALVARKRLIPSSLSNDSIVIPRRCGL